MWEANLGVRMDLLQTEWAIYIQDLQQRRFQMFGGLGWIADYPDPENFLDVLFHGESSNNHMDYANSEVDLILERARVEQDEDARFELYHQAEELIVEDAPWVPLWHSNGGYALAKPFVNDYFLFPLVIPRFRYVYFTELGTE
jgi:ABC-type oligopeptide transport system substrate-binding subunit